MLRRQYELRRDVNADDLAFIINNTDASLHKWLPDWCVYGIEEPSPAELEAPGLRVLPVDLHTGEFSLLVQEEFRKNLSCNFAGPASLPREILDAVSYPMCPPSLSKGWKAIRCVPGTGDTFFMVVNPALIRGRSGEWISRADSLEGQLARGCVWVSLSDEYRNAIEVTVLGDCVKRYAIARRSRGVFYFIEYNEVGPWRYSEVREDSDSIWVMEFI